jgi:hypothetical protein
LHQHHQVLILSRELVPPTNFSLNVTISIPSLPVESKEIAGGIKIRQVKESRMSETKNVFTPLRITASPHPVSQRNDMFYLRLHHQINQVHIPNQFCEYCANVHRGETRQITQKKKHCFNFHSCVKAVSIWCIWNNSSA